MFDDENEKGTHTGMYRTYVQRVTPSLPDSSQITAELQYNE